MLNDGTWQYVEDVLQNHNRLRQKRKEAKTGRGFGHLEMYLCGTSLTTGDVGYGFACSSPGKQGYPVLDQRMISIEMAIILEYCYMKCCPLLPDGSESSSSFKA
jgi:hypothetical protein